MLRGNHNVSVRHTTQTDADALAEIFRTSWSNAYAGLIPHAQLSATLDRRDHIWWQRALQSTQSYFILEVLGKPAGYANFGISRQGGDYQGEIFELYLAPVYQGLGFGEHLFEACRSRLDNRSLKGLIVWVLRENLPAREFYSRRGGVPKLRRIDVSIGTPLDKLGYVWE